LANSPLATSLGPNPSASSSSLCRNLSNTSLGSQPSNFGTQPGVGGTKEGNGNKLASVQAMLSSGSQPKTTVSDDNSNSLASVQKKSSFGSCHGNYDEVPALVDPGGHQGNKDPSNQPSNQPSGNRVCIPLSYLT